MGTYPHDEQSPSDKSLSPHTPLQCIGSFKAYTQAGNCHTVEIWTHFDPIHDRDRSRVAPGQLILTTTDGHGVERVDQGEYHLTDNPEVRLSTDDPNAP